MSDIGMGIFLAMNERFGGRAPASPVDTTRGRLARMRAIEAGYGGPKGAAAAIGVSPGTWTRWKHTGKKIQHPSVANLGNLVRVSNVVYRAMSKRTAERELAKAKVNVSADVRWNGYLDRKAYRTVKLDKLNLSEWAGQWVAGDLQGLAVTLWHAMHAHYGVSVIFEGQLVHVEFRE